MLKWSRLTRYLLGRDQQDLMLGLLQAFLGARDLDLVTGVIGSWDLDFGGSLELKLLKLLPVFADDKAMVLLGDAYSSRGLLGGSGGGKGGFRTDSWRHCTPPSILLRSSQT